MVDYAKLAAARERILALNYPPTTLTIATSRAAGHRLARPVLAKSSLPSRPLALTDGLAVVLEDVRARRQIPQETGPATDAESTAAGPAVAGAAGSSEPAPEFVPRDDVVRLQLRRFPATNRREDALVSGQAIAVPVGGEVPRGGELVYPFSELAAGAAELAAEAQPVEGDSAARSGEAAARAGEAESGNAGEDEDLPVAEPPRDWDLPARYGTGEIELSRTASELPRNMIGIGEWARNREVLLPEKTVLRPGELALLLALGVDEIEVYRRPVVGIASLGLPLPAAGRSSDIDGTEHVCPLATLATYLARAARVAALPLGFAPQRFYELVRTVENWANQVDILLLVGGSHQGPRCRGLDVIRTAGEVTLAGLDLTPGGSLSAGRINGKPVIAVPGSMPDVLVDFVLLVRPLAHKYLPPHLFEGELSLALANGSRLRVERDTAVPVRFSFDRERGVRYTRFAGEQGDPWLDYVRGQALAVLEGNRSYADDEMVAAYCY